MASRNSNDDSSWSLRRRKLFDHRYPWLRDHEDDLWSAAAGCAAFFSTLALSTLSQQRLLGVSTGTAPPLPTALGLVSVGLASWASHHAAIAAQQYLRHGAGPYLQGTWPSSSTRQSSGQWWTSREELAFDWRYLQIPKQTVRICFLGLLTFKVLGGRFWAVAPSSYTHVGSFARVVGGSIPATHKYATAAERLRVERLGRFIGCHTCGSHKLFTRDSFRFVGDHQPPKAIAEQLNRRWHRRLFGWKVNYRFFPQCRDCSSIQGGILAKATVDLRSNAGGSRAMARRTQFFAQVREAPSYFHGWRPRLYHLTGAVLGTVAVAGASDADLQQGNVARYLQLEQQLVDWSRSLERRVRDWIQ